MLALQQLPAAMGRRKDRSRNPGRQQHQAAEDAALPAAATAAASPATRRTPQRSASPPVRTLPRALRDVSIEELQTECRLNGLNGRGSRPKLVRRLREAGLLDGLLAPNFAPLSAPVESPRVRTVVSPTGDIPLTTLREAETFPGPLGDSARAAPHLATRAAKAEAGLLDEASESEARLRRYEALGHVLSQEMVDIDRGFSLPKDVANIVSLYIIDLEFDRLWLDTSVMASTFGMLKAAATGDILTIRALAGNSECDPVTEAFDGVNRTPLHLAAWYGHAEAVRVLVSEGADRDVHDDSGSSPLHLAAGAGHCDVAAALLDCGAAVEGSHPSRRRFRNGRLRDTAAQAAAYWGNLDMVQLLVGHGASILEQGHTYDSLLVSAQTNANLREAVRLGAIQWLSLVADAVMCAWLGAPKHTAALLASFCQESDAKLTWNLGLDGSELFIAPMDAETSMEAYMQGADGISLWHTAGECGCRACLGTGDLSQTPRSWR